jgi:hypothetical protein
MLTTVKGYYDHGKIILHEHPEVQTKTEVIVTFLTEENVKVKPGKRKLGGLEGLVNLPNDFNEPLDDLKEYM